MRSSKPLPEGRRQKFGERWQFPSAPAKLEITQYLAPPNVKRKTPPLLKPRFPQEESIHRADIVHHVREAIIKLDDRDFKIITMRFGLGPYQHPYSLQAIANFLHLSKERVRQLESVVLKRLKIRLKHLR